MRLSNNIILSMYLSAILMTLLFLPITFTCEYMKANDTISPVLYNDSMESVRTINTPSTCSLWHVYYNEASKHSLLLGVGTQRELLSISLLSLREVLVKEYTLCTNQISLTKQNSLSKRFATF